MASADAERDLMYRLIGIVILLCILTPIIWFSIRAKPLGTPPHQLPFRWGTFLALVNGLMGLGFTIETFDLMRGGDLTTTLPVAILAGFSWVTCVLLFRRRRSAVAVFIFAYAFLAQGPAVTAIAEGRPLTGRETWAEIPVLIFAALSGLYLWRRRKLLAGL
jgi:hypothetical protein